MVPMIEEIQRELLALDVFHGRPHGQR
jgi:hypothetical protein